jgi:lipopolysaccharide heptosyltransferase I
MNILLVRLGALGDIVHTLPVAAALRAHLPGSRLDWLVDVRHAPLLDLVPVLDGRVRVDSGRPSSLVAVTRELRRRRYDIAVDLQGLVKSAALARLSGAGRVAGFTRRHLREGAASLFYGQRVEPRAGGHVIDKNLSLLEVFGIEDRARRFPIDVPASTALAPVAERVARDGRRGYALVNPGAAWPNKRWPPDRFGEVSSRLATRHGLVPVVLWGPGEQGLARAVVAASAGAAMAAPPTGVADILALACGARVMISGDTGPLHLAAAVGAPLVAMFGPTDAARNGPWNAADISLSRFGECVCHYRRRCRRDRACIEDLSVEDVSGAIDRRLAADRDA